MILFKDDDAPPPEVQVEALEARAGTKSIGWMVLDRHGRAMRAGSNYAWFDESRGVAETKAAEMNALTAKHPSFERQPFRVVPVGPAVDLKPFGWGAVDETGLAMNQLVYRSREALDGRVPDGFEVVPLFYVPPPDRPVGGFDAGLEAAARIVSPEGHEGGRDRREVAAEIRAMKRSPPRPAEAVEPDPRAERWAAIPKAGKP